MYKLILNLGKNILEDHILQAHQILFLEIRTPSRRSNVHSNLEEVDFSSTIPDLKYSRPDQNIQTSLYKSPTYSQMMSPNDEPAQLMVMTAVFEIDKEYLRT